MIKNVFQIYILIWDFQLYQQHLPSDNKKITKIINFFHNILQFQFSCKQILKILMDNKISKL